MIVFLCVQNVCFSVAIKHHDGHFPISSELTSGIKETCGLGEVANYMVTLRTGVAFLAVHMLLSSGRGPVLWTKLNI